MSLLIIDFTIVRRHSGHLLFDFWIPGKHPGHTQRCAQGMKMTLLASLMQITHSTTSKIVVGKTASSMGATVVVLVEAVAFLPRFLVDGMVSLTAPPTESSG